MCCRYYMDVESNEAVLDLPGLSVREAGPLPVGDIHPSDKALILSGAGGGAIRSSCMRWGFPGPSGKGLLINARSETALQKPSFSESLLERRCIIPAAGFYEWDSLRQQVTFTRPSGGLLFMAGIYRFTEEAFRFVILTTGANASMAPVHDRMPLLLEAGEIGSWLEDRKQLTAFLKKEPALLDRQYAFRQLTLDL